MNFEACLRITEILAGSALFLQSAESLSINGENRIVFLIRALMALLLLFGIYPAGASAALLFIGFWLIIRFQGPYNGGSDRMSLLILICVFAAENLPSPYARQVAMGYLALQVVLSYFIAGVVKIAQKQWREGSAMVLVLAHSNYPMVPRMREWARFKSLLGGIGWLVVIAELLFPLAMLNQTALFVGLIVAGTFHLMNAMFFGLNRFFWIWIASYPSLIWLQSQAF